MSSANYLKRLVRFVFKGQPIIHTTASIIVTAPHHSLDGRRIIVTGGAKGLGRAIACKAVSEGAEVLITGRNEANLIEAASEIKCKYLVFDVTDISSIPQFIQNAESILGGKVDSLVSNAGISLHEGNFRNVTENGWDSQMNTNLKGNYFLVKSFVEQLEKWEDKKGNIVVISSERSRRTDDIPYGLTKVATNSFIQSMAKEVISEGIRINGVAPGVTASEMTGYSKDGDLFVEWQAGKRIFIPEEVAEVVAFLLGDSSNCISGEIITCNQGRHIARW